MEPAGRLARGSIELALRADVAAHRRRRVVRMLSGRKRRVAVTAVSPAGHSWRDRDAEVLSAPAQGSSAAGQAQSAPEARVHAHRSARGAVGSHGLRYLQADAILLAHW